MPGGKSDKAAFLNQRNVAMSLNQALEEAFAVFGEDMKNAVLRQLERSAGIHLDQPLTSLSKLSAAIAALCGASAAELIMESVVVRLDCNTAEPVT
jgi:hypothetical protein